jgi:hypothetical protein
MASSQQMPVARLEGYFQFVDAPAAARLLFAQMSIWRAMTPRMIKNTLENRISVMSVLKFGWLCVSGPVLQCCGVPRCERSILSQ